MAILRIVIAIIILVYVSLTNHEDDSSGRTELMVPQMRKFAI